MLYRKTSRFREAYVNKEENEKVKVPEQELDDVELEQKQTEA